MAFPYQKILCPVDFDENSMQALDEAIGLARHFKAAIDLVHVVPLVIQYSDFPMPGEYYEEERQQAKTKLNEIAANKLAGVDNHVMTYIGDIVGSILEAIEKSSPDLVVMATHGRTGLSHFFLGSVAEAVVRKSKSPVLTIRAGQAANP
jgi:universal stress protein A